MIISLRNVKKDDWNFIMNLRNDLYKFFYIQKKPLTKKEHYSYMKKQSKNPDFYHWMIRYEQNDVGYVRILNNDVGIMIKKEFQNKGIASHVLKLVEKEAKKIGLKKLIALISVKNKPSMKIFTKNNYSLKMYWLEKEI